MPRFSSVNEGKSYIGDVKDEVLGPLVRAGTLRGATDPAVLGWADAVIICVPTPLNKTKDPDISADHDRRRGPAAPPASAGS